MLSLMTTTQDIETLITAHTAFRSFGEFKQAVHRDGYVPTVSMRRSRALGRELESRGYRVFWVR